MTTSASPIQATVVPAQLGFLAIFNPSLGATDETLDNQIVYYASVNTQPHKRRHRSRGKATTDISQEERNERLRQIGLAQGMVEFSRGFAQGEPLDTIETEKTRVVLHEVEPGWWILASIDLTKIPLPPRLGQPAANKTDQRPENVEYSSRELKPNSLLMHDLLRAHSIFLLHHASSLSALFVKSKRPVFVKLLSRYWDLFLSTWDVMLHGNPASNIFGGIKVAACGELGVGVGEEDRGSGEREVLEGLVNRVEGLTDLVVSKFGPSEQDGKTGVDSAPPWLGTGEEAGAEDGAIFLGVGALSRKSLRDITYWMEDIYTWGENAYGVKESPTSTRQTKRAQKSAPNRKGSSEDRVQPGDRINPSSQGLSSRDRVSKKPNSPEPTSSEQVEGATDESGMNKLMSYLRMGYGTHWTLGSPGGTEDGAPEGTLAAQEIQGDKAPSNTLRQPSVTGNDLSAHYLIGLLGDMEEPNSSESESRDQPNSTPETSGYDSRVLLRTLTVELDNAERMEAHQAQDLGSQSTELTLTRSGSKDIMDPNSRFDSQDRNKTQKMRVVVYVNRPFMFTFLFQNRTDSLAWDGLYWSLHHQLAPLRKPLVASTAYRPDKPDVGEVASHIFDLVWDPKTMTVHSTIPSIPTPAEILREHSQPVWSRAEAVNTHNQILNMYVATLTDYSELERTCKTNRGWWIVWTRILGRDTPKPSSSETDISGEHSRGRSSIHSVSTLRPNESMDSNVSRGPGHTNPPPKPTVSKEIFLIRRAGEHTGLRGISSSYADSGGSGWAEGASRLAQGIGVDTHKYIEGLLSVGR